MRDDPEPNAWVEWAAAIAAVAMLTLVLLLFAR